MISYQTLLQEIEQLAASTKNSKDDQKIREQLSAIRALCNVGLTDETKNPASPRISAAAVRPAQTMQPIQYAQPQQIIQSTSSLNEQKLDEKDANGESLFDF
ncbi:hypothetical protein D1B33_04195 [Lysinibacillus yapensis]|uniref:Uncharacterized protein n=1 Tax=Ureibacillus yapensis TaxID=2304605 RepID=A0A396SF29_9BACL|nr:YwdI family protein [Lysinibacillus yapensis]RHW40056.1 hypothetical protein D1B33_04195 [Lysinibacillus yapensis]